MLKIGIIEDIQLIRIRIEQLLAKLGNIETEIINTHALNLINGPSIFNNLTLLIIDLDNRELDSIELISIIRKIKNMDKIPILAISKSSDIAFLNSAIASGCSHFVVKPFNDETFISRIQKILEMDQKTTKTLYNTTTDDIKLDDVGVMFAWCKDFKIGVDEIDEEHKNIIQEFDKLYQKMKNGKGIESYAEVISFLKEYVEKHFEHEEQLQREMNYNKYPDHKSFHDQFREKLTIMLKDNKTKAITNSDVIHINLFIKDWLVQHILIEDRKIGQYMFMKNK